MGEAPFLLQPGKLGLAEETADTLTLTERGRFLGGGVTVELLA